MVKKVNDQLSASFIQNRTNLVNKKKGNLSGREVKLQSVKPLLFDLKYSTALNSQSLSNRTVRGLQLSNDVYVQMNSLIKNASWQDLQKLLQCHIHHIDNFKQLNDLDLPQVAKKLLLDRYCDLKVEQIVQKLTAIEGSLRHQIDVIGLYFVNPGNSVNAICMLGQSISDDMQKILFVGDVLQETFNERLTNQVFELLHQHLIVLETMVLKNCSSEEVDFINSLRIQRMIDLQDRKVS